MDAEQIQIEQFKTWSIIYIIGYMCLYLALRIIYGQSKDWNQVKTRAGWSLFSFLGLGAFLFVWIIIIIVEFFEKLGKSLGKIKVKIPWWL